jgi:hypothetical protein
VATTPTDISLWETIKNLSPIFGALVNVIVVLIVYVWTNKSKDDSKSKDDIASLPAKIKEELKEWMQLKEIYVTSCVAEHTKDIETLFTKVAEVDKLASRVHDKLEDCEKRCSILRRNVCKDDN